MTEETKAAPLTSEQIAARGRELMHRHYLALAKSFAGLPVIEDRIGLYTLPTGYAVVMGPKCYQEFKEALTPVSEYPALEAAARPAALKYRELKDISPLEQMQGLEKLGLVHRDDKGNYVFRSETVMATLPSVFEAEPIKSSYDWLQTFVGQVKLQCLQIQQKIREQFGMDPFKPVGE